MGFEISHTSEIGCIEGNRVLILKCIGVTVISINAMENQGESGLPPKRTIVSLCHKVTNNNYTKYVLLD